MPEPRNDPSVDEFFTDPKHQRDRDFMTACFDRHVENRMREAAARRKENKPADTVWDKFLSLFSSDSDEHENVFDRVFGGKRR